MVACAKVHRGLIVVRIKGVLLDSGAGRIHQSTKLVLLALPLTNAVTKEEFVRRQHDTASLGGRKVGTSSSVGQRG